ncbi:MipA/OmpV family protein [Thalassotalea ponticola]|uniref:MipA/OmpV family protein n=1 Tax=Thalassotalea ponticola TaxID=1523392 RepID=UPI0025B36BC7|nr:MipA/OmpV family protein [Thalassotalea ponticola]MDN3651832.1 MipA/OmpV family protein [Thalassotalea ponticola]
MLYRSLAMLLFCCISAIGNVIANEDDQVAIKQWHFSLSAGYGVIETPIARNDDLEFYLYPRVSYYSDRFFIENTTLGYAVYEQGPVIIDVVGRLNEDGLYFKLDDVGVLSAVGFDAGRGEQFYGVDDVERDLSYLAGVAVNYDLDFVYATAGYYHDISAVHHGDEIDLSLSKVLTIDQLSVRLELQANRKSRDLIDYYYQILPEESVIFVGTYQPGKASINYQTSVSFDYQLSRRWSLTAFYRKTWLGDGISDSLIIDTDSVDLFFTGVTYRFNR